MKQFKGTKGKWFVEPNQNKGAWIGNSENEFSALSCGKTNEEAKANALLISKAPEMLDMLGKWSILNENKYKDLAGFILRTRELIKKATEI